jgi:hypothetical protein
MFIDSQNNYHHLVDMCFQSCYTIHDAPSSTVAEHTYKPIVTERMTKEDQRMKTKPLQALTERYPHWMPLKEAAPLLGVSPRQLSRLIAERREPFCSIGADIGVGQHYCRVYTQRLMRYLSGEDGQE